VIGDQLTVPWVESPFFESILHARQLSSEQERVARQYHDQGYAVLEGLLSEAEAQQVVREVEPVYSTSLTGAQNRYLYYTPLFSNRSIGAYELREHVIDIRTGAEVRQSWNGRHSSRATRGHAASASS
jgi:hypothetical protein